MESSSNAVVSNGITFTKTTYNGITVIVDDDGYYNASKICKDNGTKYSYINRCQYWTDYIAELEGGCVISPTPLIMDRTAFTNEVKGMYVHPLLVNWLCMHLDYKYAIKVSMVMNLINERAHLENSSLQDQITSLKLANADLKQELTELKEDYEMQGIENEILHENKKNLKKEVDELKPRAVPKGTNRKLLRIIQHVDGNYQLIADQSISDKKLKENGCKIINHFIFPSAMHVRQVASDLDKERIKMMKFKPCTYREVYEVITSEQPIDEW